MKRNFGTPRVLIVSSEELHVDDLSGSIFEINQAGAISGNFDSAILAVNRRRSLFSILKAYVGKRSFSAAGLLTSVRESLFQRSGFCRLGANICLAYMPPTDRVFSASLEEYCLSAMKRFEVILTSFQPNILHAHGRFLLAGEFARRVKAKYGIPYIYTDHSSFYASQRAPVESRAVLKKVLLEADVVSAVSTDLASRMRTFSGLDGLAIEVLPNCASRIFEDRPLPSAIGTSRDVVCIASLIQIKRIDVLLNGFALALEQGFKGDLRIAGDGPLRSSLAERSKRLGVEDRVRFLGQLDDVGVMKVLDDSAALIVSSDSETFCVAALEALLRGVPVVASFCGGPDDFLTSDNSLRFKPGDSAGLAEQLLRLGNAETFDRNQIRNSAIARLGRAAYTARFSNYVSRALARVRMDVASA